MRSFTCKFCQSTFIQQGKGRTRQACQPCRKMYWTEYSNLYNLGILKPTRADTCEECKTPILQPKRGARRFCEECGRLRDMQVKRNVELAEVGSG